MAVDFSMFVGINNQGESKSRQDARKEILIQLAHGPVWDGNIICKSARSECIQLGWVSKTKSGFNILTASGVEHLFSCGYLKR